MDTNFEFRPYRRSDREKTEPLVGSAELLHTYTHRGILRWATHRLGIFSNYLYVLEDKKNGNIAGTVLLRRKISATLDSFRWWIFGVYLHDGYRGKKLGEKLMDYAIKELLLLKARKIHLFVNVNNIPAFKLYLKKKFSVAGLRRQLLLFTPEYKPDLANIPLKITGIDPKDIPAEASDIPGILKILIRLGKVLKLIEFRFYGISDREDGSQPVILQTLRILNKYRYYLIVQSYEPQLINSLLHCEELVSHAEIFLRSAEWLNEDQGEGAGFFLNEEWEYIMEKKL